MSIYITKQFLQYLSSTTCSCINICHVVHDLLIDLEQAPKVIGHQLCGSSFNEIRNVIDTILINNEPSIFKTQEQYITPQKLINLTASAR